MAQKPESANAGSMSRVNGAIGSSDASADAGAGAEAGADAGADPVGESGAGSPVGAGFVAKTVAATRRSMPAATAAVFQSPIVGISTNPARATPQTAPAVLMA